MTMISNCDVCEKEFKLDELKNWKCFNCQTIYLKSCCISKADYNEYIRTNSHKSLNKFVDDNVSDDDESFIECYTIGLYNSCGYRYDQCWLIDDNSGHYVPVLITDINTSSCMAMWSCGIYRDEEPIEMTLNEVIEDFIKEGFKKSFKKVIIEYIKNE
jgi:hypothetical protein